jgi:hypothetical protein
MRTKSSILTKLSVIFEDLSSEEILELLSKHLGALELEDLLTGIEEND